MTNKNKPFQATEYTKKIDTNRDVIPYIGNMAICLDQGIVIITKQQAMDFWGLCEDNDNIDQEKCPAIDGYCGYYECMYDDDHNGLKGEKVRDHCMNKDNKQMIAGNCNSDLCPILVKNN